MPGSPQADALPDDVDALKALIQQRDLALHESHRQLQHRDAQLTEQHATIDQLKRENEGLAQRMQTLLRRLYGRSSERIDTSQLLLFGQTIDGRGDQTDTSSAEASQDDASKQPTNRRRRSSSGRRPLPEDLPRHRVEHPIDPEQCTCPCCGEARQRIGELVSEQLEYTPASFFVLQHVRGKYACKHCEEGGVATAQKDEQQQVIDKGLPGPGLIAHVAISKYCDHQPLYRQEQIFARHGIHISRSTMCGWLKEAAQLVALLHQLMCDRIRQSKVIHTDDTPLPVQERGRGKTKTGRLWVYLGDADHPYTIYEYTPTRARDGPANWLANFNGYLQADAFSGYEGIYEAGDAIKVACWAHARRYFYDARLSDPGRAHHALSLIRRLYDVEEQAKALNSNERYALRQQEAVPVLDELEAWLKQEQETALPKAPISQAIQYALNHWEALRRYTTDGDLAIDNNIAERAIRPLAIGRKNYLFAGNNGGGRTAAILYSLIASAKRHHLEPFAYLRDVLARIGSTPASELNQLLPDQWKQTVADDVSRPSSQH